MNSTPISIYRHILLLLMLLKSIGITSTPQLSDKAEIYHLTCSPGGELYSQFGHSAILVVDQEQNLDLVFNYGTFDFNTPNFYLKFMNGQLDYKLSVSRLSHFAATYEHEQRSVIAYRLRLTAQEKQQMWAKLSHNMEPANRNYRYDFFFDNCATRIRDLYLDIKQIDSDSYPQTGTQSYRQYLHQYLTNSPWTQQGIDLLLGVKADDTAHSYQQAFLPDYLDTLLLMPQTQHLLTEPVSIVESRHTADPSPAITPLMATLILMVIYGIITIVEHHKKQKYILFDRILLILTGLIGLLLSYLWFFTDHKITVMNYNIMWAMPFNLILAGIITQSGRRAILRPWIITTMTLLALVLVFGTLLPQKMPTMVYPVALTLLVRLRYYIRKRA